MRILILSNMYPSREKPYAGIFVKNQVEVLESELPSTATMRVEAMPRRFTGPIGSAIKYFSFFMRCTPQLFRQYDIVHVHYFVPLAFVGALYKFLHPRSRLLVTFHGGDVDAGHFAGWKGAFWRWISRSVDHGIAVGPGVSRAIARHLAVSDVAIEPAGVDSRTFFPPSGDVPQKAYDFVFVGSFNHRKGIDLLVEALRCESLHGIRIAFVGTGPLRPLIESLRDDLQVEIFDGLEQDQLRKVYWAAAFLVLPSRSEPFGLVVSEAMYCGTPAISSDQPGPASQIVHGSNGFLFETGSAIALRRALEHALRLPAEEYSALAERAASSNKEFDILVVAKELSRKYQALARPSTAPTS